MNSQKEWVNVTEAINILGIPRNDLMSYIHNMQIPFRKNGSRYLLNIKLVRAYLCRMDIGNMNRGKEIIKQKPLSKEKITNYALNNNPNVRRVVL